MFARLDPKGVPLRQRLPPNRAHYPPPRAATLLLLGLLLWTGLLLLCACGGVAVDAAPPQTGVLWCEDCAAVGMDGNLWSSADRPAAQVVGSLPHGTPVTVLEARRNTTENQTYDKVRAQGKTGWAPAALLRLQGQ